MAKTSTKILVIRVLIKSISMINSSWIFWRNKINLINSIRKQETI